MAGSTQIEKTGSEPIAIIGIGCRYPDAAGPGELWNLLMRSGNAIDSYSEHRFAQLDSFYEAAGKKPGIIPVHRGGFLKSIDRFDAQFFEMSPREAMYMDPQHRLLLEVAYEALEDAGQVSERYRGTRTAVFTGLWSSDFEAQLYRYADRLDFYVMTGGGRASAAGRLSFTFGFEGPSVTVDAACSSSLVAVHLACRSLQSGETNMALAGGANIILGHDSTELFVQAGMLAKDGHCKFGDASADGFVRSEGVAMVVLKRLSDAIADRDPVCAVVRGSAVNNDGRTNGLMMTPSVEGQRNLLLQSWRNAGIDPRQIRYLEAHGTGTAAGDPVELEAFGSALLASGVSGDRCYVGSIKSNIGHTESAAGVAGLIKVALGMRRRMIPPSLHFHEPTPRVDWEQLPVQILTEPMDLSGAGEEMLAGVSSFGLTGTNAHVVVAPYLRVEQANVMRDKPILFTTSAHSPDALAVRLRSMAGLLRDPGNTQSLVDTCYTSSARRSLHDFRFAAVAQSNAELADTIEGYLEQLAVDGAAAGKRLHGSRKVVFVAPGQGSQSVGMARELLELEPVFRASIEQCSAAIEHEAGWSLLDRAFGAEAEEFLSQIDVIQPALFAVSVALAELWRSRGVEPSAVVGHSMGEVAAAHIAGILSLEDAVAVICRRSRLMKTIRGSGAMATVELPAEEVRLYTEASDGRISVGASNSPGTTVISGDPDAIDDLLTLLELKDIFCRRIKVDVASHSSQVDSILPALVAELGDLRPRSAILPMLSTVTGKYVDGGELDAGYWRRNLRQPVLFASAVDTLACEGHDIFLELSPHPILLPAIEATLRATRPAAVAIASLRRGQADRANLLRAMGALFTAGYSLDWSRIYPESARCVELPSYPFQRDSYWPESSTQERERGRSQRRDPLIGQPFRSSLHASAILFEADFNSGRLTYLPDHRVRDMVVLPASAHIECALEAARAVHPETRFDIADLSLINALTLPESGAPEVQIVLLPLDGHRFSFEISSRARGSDSSWTIHSTGKLQPRDAESDPSPLVDLSLRDDPRAGHCAADAHYRTMARSGIEYGPAFQLWAEAWNNADGTLSRITIPAIHDESVEGYLLHPALLDACFQCVSQIGPLDPDYNAVDTYLPVAMERLALHQPIPPEGDLFVYGELARGGASENRLALDLRVADASGILLFEVTRLEAQRIRKQSDAGVADLLFNLEWLPVPCPALAIPEDEAVPQHWMIFSSDASGQTTQSLGRIVTSRGGCCTVVDTSLPRGSECPTVMPPSPGRTVFTAIDPQNADHLARVLHVSSELPISAVIHVSGADMATGESLADRFFSAQAAGVELLPKIVQALLQAEMAPRLWMVTAGAILVDESLTAPSLNSSTIWGMGMVIAREHPELRPCVVDLSPVPGEAEIGQLAQSILSDESADRLALRGSLRYEPRFTRFSAHALPAVTRPLHDDEEFQAILRSPGILDEIKLQAVTRRAPGPGEVAIEIEATSLNFIEVLKAMGVYPGIDPSAPVVLGSECAGCIVAVGEGVTEWRTGDEVVALPPDAETVGLLASYAVVPAGLVARKPAHLSMEEAAALPQAYVTAYLSLVKLAHICAGETVLIHSGAGGVGLAAVEIALRAGGSVIATASTPEKRAYLKDLGVSHVFDSRSLDFGQQVLDVTSGGGVDIVINSLAGEAIAKSMDVLAPFGRFIELGKRDIYEDRRIGLKNFRQNISYHVVDGAALRLQRQPYLTSLLRYAIDQVAQGHWRPLPVTIFPVSQPAEPFRYMASGRHIGKVVVSIDRDVQVLPATDRPLFSSDATYLITGGLGGVGSAVAEWMASNGARHLVIASRRMRTAETEAIVERIRACGSDVVLASVDISKADDVSSLMNSIHRDLPPLRGIMHAAAAIDDVLVRDLTPGRYARSFDAKVRGALNLYKFTKDDGVDFCVFFSSIAAIYPQPGVGGYAAANLFLDSFARYLRAQGFPATSINWGAWEKTGLARESGTSRSISAYEEQGVFPFTISEGLACLKSALEHDRAQLLTFRIEPATFAAFHGQTGVPPLFTLLVQEAAVSNADTGALPEIQLLLAAATSEKHFLDVLENCLQQQLSKVLRLSIDRIESDRPFGTIGLDSLMGLEFVRRINAGLGITLSATVVFNYPTVRQLARHILTKLRAASTLPRASVPVIEEAFTDVGATFSEAEALQALTQGTFEREPAFERGRA